jgi:hypothetical protein
MMMRNARIIIGHRQLASTARLARCRRRPPCSYILSVAGHRLLPPISFLHGPHRMWPKVSLLFFYVQILFYFWKIWNLKNVQTWKKFEFENCSDLKIVEIRKKKFKSKKNQTSKGSNLKLFRKTNRKPKNRGGQPAKLEENPKEKN